MIMSVIQNTAQTFSARNYFNSLREGLSILIVKRNTYPHGNATVGLSILN